MNVDAKHPLSQADWHRRYQQQAEWTAAIRDYLFTKASLQPDEKILEVGSGTGALLGALAQAFNHPLTGIDINNTGLLFNRSFNPSARLAQADGYHLPFPSNSFAITYCHYLLLWIEQPIQILSEMCRVTRPDGSVIALAEPDHDRRIDFPPPLDHLGTLQTAALLGQGADTAMGRKLRYLFHEAGLTDVDAGILAAQWHPPHEATDTDTEWKMVCADLADRLSEDELATYQQIDRQARQDESRILFIPTFYAIGTVR